MDHRIEINLRLFDGGSAADGGGTTAGETTAIPADAGQGITGETKAAAADAGRRRKKGRSGAKAETQTTVLYGKQGDAPAAEPLATKELYGSGVPLAGTEPVTPPKAETKPKEEPVDKRKTFMELVTGEGEYREQFAEQVQQIINGRFRQTKELEDRVAKTQPLLELLQRRYNLTDSDPVRLLAALEGDDAYWSDAARRAGMTVDQYRMFQHLQMENDRFRRQQASAQELQRQQWSNEKVQGQLRKWYSEADEVKKTYPDFDLTTEVRNPQFISMLKSDVPIRQAYEVLHMDAIKNTVAQQTAQKTEKQVVDGIRAKGTRPQENGTAAQSGFVVKDDVSKLTRQDRAEIAKRVARGEIIRF